MDQVSQLTKELIKIQNTPGKNDKRSLLDGLAEQHQKVLALALNPRFPMFIGEETTLAKVQEVTRSYLLPKGEQERVSSLPLLSLMQSLNNLSIPQGHQAIASLGIWLNRWCSTNQEKEIILSLIQKNPRLGVSWHSYTKVTDTYKFEVMLAKDINKVKNLEKKVKFPVYVQPKLDGYRAIANTDGKYELKSRNGKVYENFPTIVEALRLLGYNEDIPDGEIMSDDFQSMQKSAFASKRGTTVGDVKYFIFDVIQNNEFSRKICDRNFSLRLKELEKYKDRHPLIKVVETIMCNTWEEVYDAHARFIEQGFEGTMVRLNKPYEFKRTDNLMKIKDMLSQDCTIKQVIEGKGKYAGVMGAIKVLQEDGQTLCEVGTGFSDEARAEFWKNKKSIIGSIVEIKFQELTPDGVMRFPVFMRFRNDK